MTWSTCASKRVYLYLFHTFRTCTMLGYNKTNNNILEGGNTKFQNLIRLRHPNLYVLIKAWQIMNSITSMDISKSNVDVKIDC